MDDTRDRHRSVPVEYWKPIPRDPVGTKPDVSMTPERSTRSTSDLLVALADERRRRVIEYLSTGSSDVASVSELAEYAATNCSTAGDAARAAVRLHHVTVPTLADAGLVEYDPRSRTVRYRGGSEVADLLGYLRKRCP